MLRVCVFAIDIGSSTHYSPYLIFFVIFVMASEITPYRQEQSI